MNFCAILCVLFAFAGCEKKHDEATLRLGVTNGPHGKIAEFVVAKAKAQGMNVKITYFDDFIQPNALLEAGELDMNIYQHEPFLKEQIAARGYHLSIMGKAILLPLGIYGGAGVKSLEDVKMGAKVIIPNDPTNGARALLLLQRAGLIKLKTMEACDLIGPTLADIVENPKNLKIMEVEAPLLPRLLQEDASLAVINADWVIVAGMDPKTSMIHEDAINSPYTNVIVVKEGAETRKNTLEFVKLYQSDDVKKFIAQEFKGAVVAGW